jgi:hypothetical protein
MASLITAFTYKKKVTLNTTSGGGNIASSLTDFPVLLVINPTSWPTAAEHESFFAQHGRQAHPDIRRRRHDQPAV